MPIKGTSKLTELRLAQLSVDLTKPTVEINVTAALGDPNAGIVAWAKFSGNVWGKETQQHLRDLLASMENDMATVVMSDTEHSESARSSAVLRHELPAGLGEALRSDDPDQM